MVKSKSSVKEVVLRARQIEKHYPNIWVQFDERVKHLPVIFEYYADLRVILSAFCDFYSIPHTSMIGIRHGMEVNELKKKFVATMILCFHPDMITGHDEKIQNSLCKEIAHILGCKREQISMFASNEIPKLDPDKSFGAYTIYQKEISEVVEYLKGRFEQRNEDEGESNLFEGIAV